MASALKLGGLIQLTHARTRSTALRGRRMFVSGRAKQTQVLISQAHWGPPPQQQPREQPMPEPQPAGRGCLNCLRLCGAAASTCFVDPWMPAAGRVVPDVGYGWCLWVSGGGWQVVVDGWWLVAGRRARSPLVSRCRRWSFIRVAIRSAWAAAEEEHWHGSLHLHLHLHLHFHLHSSSTGPSSSWSSSSASSS